MNCNIIKDLLPSYIDDICSDETRGAVEKHMKNCVECERFMHLMQQPTNTNIVEADIEVAKEPFKRINKKRRLQVIAAIAITFMVTIITALVVVQEVGAVKQYFFPIARGIVDIADDKEEWVNISFSPDWIDNSQKYIIYDRIFWKKEIINDVSNESDVYLRVKDEKGTIVIDEFQLPAGTGIKLDELKRNVMYYVEIKAPEGQFRINAT